MGRSEVMPRSFLGIMYYKDKRIVNRRKLSEFVELFFERS